MTQDFSLFITGTGTDVGKTVTSRALMEGLAMAGLGPRYWKPVQTGDVSDAAFVAEGLAALRLPTGAAAPAILPEAFHFPLPASPDQAAEAAGRDAPTLADLAAAWPQKAATPLLIEGAGGLLVPLNPANETWLDLIAARALPTLVVASPRLGTLNHTALTLRELGRAGVAVAGVVLSGERHEANEASLRRAFPGLRLFALPHCPGLAGEAWRQACDALAAWVREGLAALPAPRDTADLLAADARVVWHPYTQHRTAPAPLVLRRAKGVWLEAADGRRYVDGTSSWWVNTIGHGRPEIAAAIAAQQQELDHVIFAGATHEPAVALSEALTAKSGHLSRAFYTDNGSCAVEVAVKIAVQYWHNRGETDRNLVLTFQGAYHGDTFGAMSVGQSAAFHAAYKKLRFPTLAASPVTAHPAPFCPEGPAAREAALQDLEALFAREKSRLAAVLIEPWVQGASGMHVQDLDWLRGLAALSRAHGVPLIFDEVFTGMGRTGDYFAYRRLGLEPDVVCLAKGLTGGNMPLAVTLARESLFEGFLGEDTSLALLHGHSYTANPIACRAALATLGIYEREDLCGAALRLESAFQEWARGEGAARGIQSARVAGAILAFELPGTRASDYFNPAAKRFAAAAMDQGLMLRPLGNTAYLVPPLTMTPAECAWALGALGRALETPGVRS